MGEPGNDSEMLMNPIDGASHPYDAHYTVNSGYEGGKFAKPIQAWLREHSLQLPGEPQLLGLGAGVANPECSLAEILEIPYKDVTLVDKNPNIAKHPILTEHRQGVRYLAGTGIFRYLENPDRKDFSVVTAIGLEYLLGDLKLMENLIRLLPGVLLPHSFVCVYPESINNPEQVWSETGFEKVKMDGSRDYSGSLLYVYTGPVRKL